MTTLQLNEGDIFLRRGETAIFLLHGFFSTPEELTLIANMLADDGLTVYCPCLPSYSSYKKASLIDFCSADYAQWQKEAEKSFLDFKKEFNKVYIGGHSWGANLAILLASKHEVEGIISLGAAIYLSIFLRWSRKIVPFIARVLVKENAVAFFQATSDLNILNMTNIVKETKKALPTIKQPILIVHSKDDKMVLPQSADCIRRRVRSKNKKQIFVKNKLDNGHGLVYEELGPKIAKEISKFICLNSQ
ncbi:MAG: alpha/beta fold hydrolase [Candidatus Paceibacterota bacterium]|jgi:carboxylesterase